MQVQITDVGVALLQAQQGPIELPLFQLGSAYNFVPQGSDTGIHGTEVYSGPVTPYGVVNANVVKYSMIVDTQAPTIDFGNIGLFTSDGKLVALAASPSLIHHAQVVNGAAGDSIRIDVYLSMVGNNYDMWLDVSESNNPFRVATLNSVDQLPPSNMAVPNVYIVSGADSTQSAFEAYTDRSGMWNFDAYQYANQTTLTIASATSTSLTFDLTNYDTSLVPEYYGQMIAEFSSGALYSICRNIEAVVISPTTVTWSFKTPMAQLPAVGDTVTLFSRQQLSTTLKNLPIATTTSLGVVQIGSGLLITTAGVLSWDPTSAPVVSVNGMTGQVTVNATNITGFARVAYTGNYSDLNGAPGSYVLPIASTTQLGGVKAPQSGNLTIAADGTIDLPFAPVKTVNHQLPDGNGDIEIDIKSAVIGLTSPTAIAGSTDMNTMQTTGLYFATAAVVATIVNGPGAAGSAGAPEAVVEIIPWSTTATGGDVLQRWTDYLHVYFRTWQTSSSTWTPWVGIQTSGSLPIATTTALGAVMIGGGLQIVPSTGMLSTVIQSVNGHAQQYVTLAAADVGAVSTGSVGVSGGVASLVTGTPALNNARLPFYQAPLSYWFFAGQWNASTNQLIQNFGVGTTYDASTSLSNTGLATIDQSYGGNNQTIAYPTYGAIYQEGAIYEVTVAGTTSIDGISTWNVGDLAIAINGVWTRMPKGGGTYTLPAATATTLGGVSIPASSGLAVTAGGALSVSQATATVVGGVSVPASGGLVVASGALSLANASNHLYNNAATGVISYRQNPDGSIDYWGITSLAAGTNAVTVTLPLAAPNGFVGFETTDTGSSCFAFGITVVDNSHITINAPAFWFDPSTGSPVARPNAGCSWHVTAH